jgi:hypothetical protein
MMSAIGDNGSDQGQQNKSLEDVHNYAFIWSEKTKS